VIAEVVPGLLDRVQFGALGRPPFAAENYHPVKAVFLIQIKDGCCFLALLVDRIPSQETAQGIELVSCFLP
jgi:hypothetical protein